MLLHHTMIYSLSRGLAGVVQILAIMVLTRYLTPGEYGIYTLIITSVGLLNSLFFHSIRMSLLRYYSKEEDVNRLLSTICVWFQMFCVVILISMLLLYPYWKSFTDAHFVWILGLFYLWLLAWFELNLTLYRSKLQPVKYGYLFIAKHVLALGFGFGMVILGFGVKGLMLGIVLGTALSIIVPTCTQWRSIRIQFVDIRFMKQLLHYGLPLAVTFTMASFIHYSGRVLLGWFGSIEDTGLYAVAYDITQQSIILLMTVINLAGFPLVLKKLEQLGENAARDQLSMNATLLSLVAFPATAGLIVLGPSIAGVFLGNEFRDAAVSIMPIIAIAALLQGAKMFYFDIAFQLARKTKAQIYPVIISIMVNVGLNVWWIPLWGIVGTAYAALAAYLTGALVSYVIGNKVFRLPIPVKDILKIICATGIMVVLLIPVRTYSGGFLVLQIIYGATVYLFAAWALGIGDVKRLITGVLQKFLQQRTDGVLGKTIRRHDKGGT